MLIQQMAALLGLIILGPVLLAVTVAILMQDGSPVLFRQVRVGQNGRRFQLLKFRSMRTKQTVSSAVTAAGDPRVTPLGAFLRRYKLDELPQLWNIVRGEMSFIGPRPEVPCYVDESDSTWLEVLRARPGVTDLATLLYRFEEELLAGAESADAMYRTVVLPEKLRLNKLYLANRTIRTDIALLLLTIQYSIQPLKFDSDTIRKRVLPTC